MNNNSNLAKGIGKSVYPHGIKNHEEWQEFIKTSKDKRENPFDNWAKHVYKAVDKNFKGGN